MKPTPQQEAIFTAVRSGTSHVLTEAVAGSGKTSTMVAAAGMAAGRVGFLAFNDHIARELQTRLNGNAMASTLHSLGLRACQKHCDCQVDENKAKRLLLDLKPEWFWEGRDGRKRPGDEALATLRLTSLCKYTLSNHCDTVQLMELVERYNVDCERQCDSIFLAVSLLVEQCQASTDTVDFDDMVWLPIVRQLPVGNADVLFVDELQDLNRAQQALTLRAAPDGRVFGVGDSAQSIYGFTGADIGGIQRMRTALGNHTRACQDLPLTVTWRCPRSHVRLAQKLVPHIEAAPTAPNGRLDFVAPESVHREVMAGDMVIARRNAPLVDLAYHLAFAGVSVIMRGRDIGKGMLDLIVRLKPDTTPDLIRKLEFYRNREESRLSRRDAPEAAYQSLDDRVSSLQQLASQCETLDELRTFLAAVFSDDRPDSARVVLSSIHRAKGLEANRVVILEPEKLPLVHSDQQEWEKEQERNLAYVAVTRARQELYFAGDLPALFQ
jgi:DNA helicase-2/ATP-dependent DNA helicase PcrA